MLALFFQARTILQHLRQNIDANVGIVFSAFEGEVVQIRVCGRKHKHGDVPTVGETLCGYDWTMVDKCLPNLIRG